MDRYEFERRLKAYIREDGRSQASVARKLGIAPDTFNKWVRNVNRMPDSVIADFCALLALPPDSQVELLRLAGYTVPDARHKATNAPDERASSVLFASKIRPDGRALDPGSAFSANIADLYAVFRPDSPIPGTRVDVAQPDPAAYYAYLRMLDDSTVAKLGWRWYFNGKIVNEFQMDVKPRNVVWLQKFSYDQGGIFSAEPFWPGTYRIVILLGGNPALSAQVSITEAATGTA